MRIRKAFGGNSKGFSIAKLEEKIRKGTPMFVVKFNKRINEFEVVNSDRNTVVDTFKTQLEASSLASLLEQAFEDGRNEISFGKDRVN